MEKVYIIKELFDVDGGFGDAIETESILAITHNEELAKAYVKKYDKPQVYDMPYAPLVEHKLIYEVVELIDPDLDVDPWANTTRASRYSTRFPEPLEDFDDEDDEDDED